MTSAYKSADPSVRDALETLKTIAEATKTALMRGRLNRIRRTTYPKLAQPEKIASRLSQTSKLNTSLKSRQRHGAIGGKACGAGGGGCLLFYCEPTREHSVRQKLEEAGARVIDVNFDFDGTPNVESLKLLDPKNMKNDMPATQSYNRYRNRRKH